jgi:cardiolipin synthase C
LLGKAAGNIQNSFNDFWNSSLSVPVTDVVVSTDKNKDDKNKFDRLHQYACNPDNFWPQVRERITELPQFFKSMQESGELVWLDSVYFVTDLPGKNDGTNGLGGGGVCTNALFQLVKEAKYSIAIQSPYLITTKLGLGLFKDAVSRGVEVRILTNSLASTDNVEAFSGYQKVRKDLLKAGVKIFEFRPDAAERYKIMTGALQTKLNYKPIFGLHAKSMVVDAKTTVIGTFNLDPRSANLNTECVAIIHSTKVAKGVLNGMEEEFKPENSWQTTLTSNPDSSVGVVKRIKTMSRKIIPKSIL